MEEAFSSGWIIDIILALMALEAVALVILRRVVGRGPSVLELLVSLAAGLCLMLALRVALTGGSWPAIALALAASLVVHVTDLRLRWLRQTSATNETT